MLADAVIAPRRKIGLHVRVFALSFITWVASDGLVTILQAHLPIVGLLARALFFGVFMALFFPLAMRQAVNRSS